MKLNGMKSAYDGIISAIGKIYSVLKNLLVEIYNNIFEDNITVQGAAIAFYSIFSAAPLLFIIITLASSLGGPQTMNILVQYLHQLMGKDLAQPLIQMANATHQHVNGGHFASVLSIVTLFFGATTAILQLKASLNTIWKATEPDINSILLFVIDRLLSVLVVFVLIIILFASMILDSRMRLIKNSAHTFLPNILNTTLNFFPTFIFILISILFFMVIFKLLPDIHVRWRDIFVGACVTTVLFFIGKYLIGIYLNSSSIQSKYQTAGTFIIFLIWMYYNVQVILIGAVFTEAYTRLYGAGAEDSQNANTFSFRSLFKKLE
jgi:membrane protein